MSSIKCGTKTKIKVLLYKSFLPETLIRDWRHRTVDQELSLHEVNLALVIGIPYSTQRSPRVISQLRTRSKP